ncbi:MAG TPA: response regulator transcription factor [Gammaproteobacteria bacterium]|nr:response regulator transcription factor [Gammaproteobacteria bacterium]
MTEADKSRSVFIVDDHPIVRQGLAQLIEQEPDLSVCGEAADVREARAALTRLKPDVVILDLSLRDSDGLELIKDIRNKYDGLPVLVLSMHDENIYAERLLSSGANGYIMKQAAGDQLITALRRVLSGGIYVSERIGASMIERLAVSGRKHTMDPIERLSNREVQVLNLIGRGKTTREIARDLNLSIKTIESHRQRIKKKLSLDTSPRLVQFAVNWYAGQH